MGKGDKKSRRGKIVAGSFGVNRPRRKAKSKTVPVSKVTEKKEKKAPVVEPEVAVSAVEVAEKPKKERTKKVKEPVVEAENKAPKKTSKKKEE